MSSKMKSLALSIGVLAALLAPAVAQGAQLTDIDGVPVEVGTEVKATSANFQVTAEGGSTIACNTVTLHGEVTENGPEHVTIDKMTMTASECSMVGFAGVLFITAPAFGAITLTEGEGVSSLTFKWDHPGLKKFECHIEGGVSITYTVGAGVLNMGQEGKGSGTGCPKHYQLSAAFFLEKASGGMLKFA